MKFRDVLLEEDEEKKLQIEVTHPGMLEVPEGKKFYELPISHFVELAKRKGYKNVSRALVNIEVWNKKKHPDLSTKAKEVLTKLQKEFGKGKFEKKEKKED
jgi:hypothetical protein